MREHPPKTVARPDNPGSYFLAETGVLALVTVSGIVYNGGLAAMPWFEGQLAQCLLDITRGQKQWRDMALLAGLYLGVTLLVQGMRCLKRFYVRRFANDTARTMRGLLYNSLVHQPRAALQSESVGEAMTRAVADVDACVEGMRKFTTEVFDTGVVMVGYLGLLLWYDARLALLCCAFTLPAYAIASRLKRRVVRANAAYKQSAGRLGGATMDRIANALTYRAFGAEAGRDAAYRASLDDYARKAAAANVWEGAMQPLYNVVAMGGVLFLLYFGGRNVLGTGWTQWNLAAFTAFLSCFVRLASKTSHAAKLFNAVQKAQVSWRRIRPLLHPPTALNTDTALDPAAPMELTVSHLSFAYPGGPEILHDLSFSARPGQLVGITGPVAGGKSTLGQVFLCEAPYAGSIRLGGRELTAYTPWERSLLVGWQGHAPELLDETLAENVRLGGGAPADAALAAACLDPDLAAMPAGADTPIGAGGVRLSGGQQARTALARALYAPHPLLVLDDPFAAVDRATEAAILANLREKAPNSVILLISHRLTAFPQCDQVLWVAQGRVQCGTHAGLLQTNSGYAAFYRAQTEGGADLDEI